MSAHLNITSDIATVYGVTIAETAEADDCQKTTTVEISEVLAASTAEIIHADPVHMASVETTVSGEGPHSLTLTPGTVAVPATLTKVSVELTEPVNGRLQFSARASGALAFVDPDGEAGEVGAEPTLAALRPTSVTYAIVESVRRSSTIEDKVLPGTNGQPIARGTITRRRPFTISGRGDKPAGVVLGGGGSEFVGATTGKVLVATMMEGEKRADWNRWSSDGQHYLAA
jgi:hypothetical protein